MAIPAVPRSLILAGGPIDTRINPTAVNALAQSKGTAWFERNVITHVPWPLGGCGRQVYPGFLQLSGFMMMNLDRHIQAHREMFHHLVRGDGDSAAKHRKFYDEYLAVMDLTAEFYLQTIDSVFVQHLLPRGLMTSRGRIVDLGAIRRPALMTVEGEMDDITGTGQCSAALKLCAGFRRAANPTSNVRPWATTASSTARAFAGRSLPASRVSCARMHHVARSRP